jgi:hypothetical protein
VENTRRRATGLLAGRVTRWPAGRSSPITTTTDGVVACAFLDTPAVTSMHSSPRHAELIVRFVVERAVAAGASSTSRHRGCVGTEALPTGRGSARFRLAQRRRPPSNAYIGAT